MLILSEKYPELRLGGLAKFRGGEAEVDDPALIDRLRKYSSMGVVVPGAEELPPVVPSPAPPIDPPSDAAPPADNAHVAAGAQLFEPKGNASIEEWHAYAIQKGVDADGLEGLKREEIKALLSE